MVTHFRVQELKTRFQQDILKSSREEGDEDDDSDDPPLSLELYNELLFTEAEKEHLPVPDDIIVFSAARDHEEMGGYEALKMADAAQVITDAAADCSIGEALA